MKIKLSFLCLIAAITVSNAQVDSSTRVLINDQQWTGYEHSVISQNNDLNLLIHGPYNSGITKMDSNFTHLRGVYYYENSPTQTSFRGLKLLQDSDSTFLVCGKHISSSTLSTGILFSVDSTLETNWTYNYKPQNAAAFEWTDAALLSNGQIFMIGKDNVQKGYFALVDGNGGIVWGSELSGLVIPISCDQVNDSTIAILANKMNANTTVASTIIMTVNLTTSNIDWQIETVGGRGMELIAEQDTLYTFLEFGSPSDLRVLINVPNDQNGTMILAPMNSGSWTSGYQISKQNNHLYLMTGSDGVYDSKITKINLNDSTFNQGNQLMNLRALHFTENGKDYIIGKGPVYGIKSSFNPNDHIGIIQGTSIDSILTDQACGFWSVNGTVTTGPYTATISSISTALSAFIVNPITLLADTVSPGMYIGCVDATSGLNEFEEDLIEVMPNPSRGEVTVKNTSDQTINLIVLDQLGRTVQQTQMITPNSSIHLDLIKVGSYFMVTRDQQNRTQTEKLVVIE